MFKLFTGAKAAPSLSHPPATNGVAAMIELRNVVKQYETAAGAYTALKGIDLSVGRGEFVAVVGNSICR